MFIVCDKPTFTHKVEVSVPVDGGFDRQDFRATFQVMTAEEAEAYDMNDGRSSAAFVRAILVGLDDLIDANKQPVPYSDALRDRLIAFPFIRAAIARTYFQAVAGAAVGN